MAIKYNQQRFCEIYKSVDEFLADFELDSSGKRTKYGIEKNITDEQLTTTYYLIFSRFGNTAINTNFDLARWKMNLQVIIFSYAPEYFAKMDIQEKVRALSIDELRAGSKTIMNTALNPETNPDTASLEELDYINQQNTSSSKLSLADAYGLKWDLLHSKLTDDFINRFNKLFSHFTLADSPLFVYDNIEEED